MRRVQAQTTRNPCAPERMGTELVHILTVNPPRRCRRRRGLDLHDSGQHFGPLLEGRPLLLVVAVAIVNGRDRAVRHTAMVEDMRDVEAINARLAHV